MKGHFITLFQTVKVMLLFIGCTLFFYYGILWVSEEYESYYRYDTPEGNAIKVNADLVEQESDVSVLTRLVWFYKLGE
ncbi:YqzK family protein [Alkalicoccobacillus porphyridii]|uniref:DUF4227 family protein n=1 Tax=Alkalicoccobacillus porphyridii TaxID=2597270 RepID=A0A553ZYQ7_9BACI|nr:YqzK family protein [Alkalicoccobacillus porphyridii]TSB46572.1 DUF4227 family protein [Alkalicoccobacillus porphyridii]